jgi:hypothetical protein
LIFKGDENPQHTFLRMGSKAGHPMSQDFTTRKIYVDVSKILNTQNSHSFVHSSYSLYMSLTVGLPASSGRQVRSYLQPATSSPRLCMLTYHRGMNSRPVMAAVLRRQSHPIMINKAIKWITWNFRVTRVG